ncbi:hypothetical protein PybrP1_001378 [[Pythium] brassicae (nom. inval.)]|nr:hypothetical protein PybrP1_001378 [[Pythium] brassicae (nom. inval.)]
MPSAFCVGLIALMAASNFLHVPVFVQVIGSATSIIYFSATFSLKLKHHRGSSAKEDMRIMVQLLWIGVAYGIFLFKLFFDKDLANLLIASYYSFTSVLSLTEVFSPLVARLLFRGGSRTYRRALKVPFYGESALELSQAWVLTFAFAAGFAYAWFQTKHYLLNNVFGVSLSIKYIELFSVVDFKYSAFLLCGVFFHDIFWVFRTGGMVTAMPFFYPPAKLMFPRAFATATEKANAAQAFPKPFFHVNLVFYVLGLVAIVTVMFVFKAVPPALLFLAPACLGSALATAFARGEFKELLAYSEE